MAECGDLKLKRRTAPEGSEKRKQKSRQQVPEGEPKKKDNSQFINQIGFYGNHNFGTGSRNRQRVP